MDSGGEAKLKELKRKMGQEIMYSQKWLKYQAEYRKLNIKLHGAEPRTAP